MPEQCTLRVYPVPVNSELSRVVKAIPRKSSVGWVGGGRMFDDKEESGEEEEE